MASVPVVAPALNEEHNNGLVRAARRVRAGADQLSVILCVFTPTRAGQLEANVRALEAGSRVPDEVVVVIDNCRALETWIAVRLPSVRTVAYRGPRGLANARNVGVALARGKIVAFVDDDTVPERDWAERLLAAYRDPQVVGAGGAAVPVWEGERPRWLPQELLWVMRGRPTQPIPVRNLSGCNMSFRRSTIIAAGGFAAGRVATSAGP